MNLRNVGDCLRCVYCGAVLGGSSFYNNLTAREEGADDVDDVDDVK